MCARVAKGTSSKLESFNVDQGNEFKFACATILGHQHQLHLLLETFKTACVQYRLKFGQGNEHMTAAAV